MSYPNVYLFRIHNIPYGFTVVAIVELSEEAAKERVAETYNCHFENREISGKHYANLKSSCGVQRLGSVAAFEFEE